MTPTARFWALAGPLCVAVDVAVVMVLAMLVW